MKLIKKLTGICAMALMIGSFSTVALAAAEVAGNVIRASGATNAKDSAGKVRVLAMGSAINVGDIVSTGQGASLQLQMKDGAIIALAADSEFKVKSYNYEEKSGKKDNVSLFLQKGRLRTITGSTPKTAYNLTTQTAIVRIHGTVYDTLATDTSSTIILREGAVEVESLCNGTGTGNSQLVDVPGTATEVALCRTPTEPKPTTDVDVTGASITKQPPPPPPPPPPPASP